MATSDVFSMKTKLIRLAHTPAHQITYRALRVDGWTNEELADLLIDRVELEAMHPQIEVELVGLINPVWISNRRVERSNQALAAVLDRLASVLEQIEGRLAVSAPEAPAASAAPATPPASAAPTAAPAAPVRIVGRRVTSRT